MKALVLAGGSGSRLRPLTHTRSKQLVPLANRPIVWYGIQAIVDAGIEEIGIISGDKLSEVKESIGDGSQFGNPNVKFTFIYQENPDGLAHAVLCGKDFLGTDDFVMYLGDNLLLDGISEIVKDFKSGEQDSSIILKKVEDPSMFGVARMGTNNAVLELIEKPEEFISDLALVGVYLFRNSIMNACESIEPSPRGELEITDAIQYLLESGKFVKANITESIWLDTGKWQDLVEANICVLQKYMDEKIDLSTKAKVINSKIIEPVIIEDSAIIENSVVGPYVSVGKNCTIINSKLESSVLMPESSVKNISFMKESILGYFATMESTEDDYAKVIVGDHSQINVNK